jgi:tRNA(fMet)-specific endonuclease VapC
MNLLFDTNIVLAVGRAASPNRLLTALNPEDAVVYVSFATIAETQSIVYQNGWGQRKVNVLENLFAAVRIIAISELLLSAYVGIDAYSQRNHPDYQHYPFDTPRNMGKNDLYIAATASLLNLQLLTTDGDFDHLNHTFLRLQRLDVSWLRQQLNG